FHRYRFLGVRDGVKHRGVEFVAVVEDCDAVAGYEWTSRRSRHSREKFVRADGKFRIQTEARDVLAWSQEIQNEADNRADDRRVLVVGGLGNDRGRNP